MDKGFLYGGKQRADSIVTNYPSLLNAWVKKIDETHNEHNYSPKDYRF